MPRKLFTWKLRSRELRLGERTLIVAVLNITPDSFSDGGQYDDPELAFARALELEAAGADVLDIGAESTKPGSVRVSAAEELRRLIPVLKRLKDQLQIPISVDTYKAEVATIALEHGVEIINDPSGFTFDPLLAKVVVESNAGLILNHMRGTPETWAKLPPMPDIMGSVVKDLDASANRARRSGVDKGRMVLDPGLGFGKRKEQNSEILARLGELVKLEYPVMTGPSRKSFLAQGNEEETVYATAAAVAASVINGAHLVRVHDVSAMRAVVAVADEVARGGRVLDEEPAKRPVGRRLITPEVAATEKPAPTRPPLLRNFETPRKFEAPPVEGELPVADVEEKLPFAPQSRPPQDHEQPRAGDRPFTPRRSGPGSDRGERSSGPKRSGPPSDRPFRGDREGGPPRRSGPPSDRGERSFGPKRSGPPSDRPFRGDREGGPPRRSGPPSDRGERSFGPKRSGPPSDRPFRGDREGGPPRRSGPPSDRGERSFGPKRSGPPSDRPFRGDREGGPPRRSGPPSDRGERSFGPKRSGPPRFGAAKKFGAPRKFGPPRKGGPKKDYPPRGPKRDS